jgi:ankyrin repeat protein
MTDWTPPNEEFPPPKPGEPPMHAAARTGDHDAIRALHADGARLDGVFNVQLDPDAGATPATPLMAAAGSGDGATADTVRLLIELGADPKQTVGRHSAAAFAAGGLGWNYKPGGDAARLRLLLDAGAPLPTTPSDRNRMLCHAAERGDPDRLRLLLDQGLSAKGHWDPEEARQSHAAFQAAMVESLPAIAEELPDDLRDVLELSVSDASDELFDDPPSAPSSFQIPLFCAAESGCAECVRLLLDAGADPMQRDDSQRTAMYAATSADAVRALLGAGLSLEDKDQIGWSPLVDAVHDGEEGLDAVRALLDCGADVNATHDRGFTVFMSAVGCMARHPDICRMLIDAGADPHAVTDLGYNAFHAAIDVDGEANEEESVRSTLTFLRELGVDLELKNASGQTPLAQAIEWGTALEVRVLCELGADPNAVCPTHHCGENGCERIEVPLLFAAIDGIGVDPDEKVEALLAAGADPLVRDADGLTPLEAAVAEYIGMNDEDDDDDLSDFDAGVNSEDDAHDEDGETSDDIDTLGILRAISAIDLPDPFAFSDRAAFISAASIPDDPGTADPVDPTFGLEDVDAEQRAEFARCVRLLAAAEAWAKARPG